MSWFTLWMIVINTSFWLAVCFGLAFAVRIVPAASYHKMLWLFKKRSYEDRLYQILHLNRWKDRLLEWGEILNFEKKNLNKELNLVYIDKFIMETYYG